MQTHGESQVTSAISHSCCFIRNTPNREEAIYLTCARIYLKLYERPYLYVQLSVPCLIQLARFKVFYIYLYIYLYTYTCASCFINTVDPKDEINEISEDIILFKENILSVIVIRYSLTLIQQCLIILVYNLC